MRSLNLVGPTCALSEAPRKLLFPSLLVPPHTATQLPGEVCLLEAVLFPPQFSQATGPESSGKGQCLTEAFCQACSLVE